MMTLGLMLTLQKNQCVHDSMNIPKVDFLNLHFIISVQYQLQLTWLALQILLIISDNIKISEWPNSVLNLMAIHV